jgi:hypothetical protein
MAAQALASAEYGLLEPVPGMPLSYQLTLLGELVAGLWLTAVLCDAEPVTRPALPPIPPLPPFPPARSADPRIC